MKSEDGAQSNCADHRKILKDLQSFIEHRCLVRVIPGVVAVSRSNKPPNQRSRSKTVGTWGTWFARCVLQIIMRAIKSLAINDRIARIKKLKICFNCFRTRHRAKACSSGSCRQCKEKYYILIHVAKKMQRTVRSIRECLPQISCSAYCNDNTERVMLSIAIVHLLE